jgi:peptidoglycan/xylan/chitin deacetylase (PgdA/CDA1 family)
MPVEVTLTFDNGPDPEATPHVLDVLAARDLKATFFVVGEQLAAARHLAERAHAEGHWIGNHTWTHRAPFGELEDSCAPHQEIERTQALIGALAHQDRLFRPVGGGGEIGPHLLTPETVEVLVAGGYTCALWNAVPGDWKDPDGWLDRALAQCRAAGRALLVLHDLPTGAMVHLERFLDTAAAEGMTFRQDLPDACVPIRRGHIAHSLDRLGGTS